MNLMEYTAHVGATERTVRRWLAADELPGAMLDDRGAWSIPADARRVQRLPAPTDRAQVARNTSGQVTAPATPATLADALAVLPAFLDVETAARLMDVGRHALVSDPMFRAARVGPNGAWRIPAAVVREAAGL